MRILLDTDIGDDIDDALALALALRHPNIEIAGVTTVFRDTRARARMARHLLTQYGYGDVPVYVGAGKPLLEPMPREPHEPQLDMTPDDVQRIDGIHAVEAIRAMYAQPGSDVTLVTIGPLTNLALALALDPTLADRIPRVVAMGGYIGRTAAEWNIKCDPEAAAIVLQAGLPLTLVPLDVTLGTAVQPRHLEAIEAATDAATRWLVMLIDAWRRKATYKMVLHDPLAIAVALDQSWVETERMALDVVTREGAGRGITCVVADAAPPVEVALRCDGPRFVDWYVEQVLGAA